MLIDLMQYEDGAWKGFVIIIDLNRVTLGHIARLDLQTIQQLLYYLQVSPSEYKALFSLENIHRFDTIIKI